MDQEVCPKCHKLVISGAKFCPECGAGLTNKKAGSAEAKSTQPKKNTAVRDAIIIVGVLAVVTAAYFIFKEQPLPPEPAPADNTPAQKQSSTPSASAPAPKQPDDMMGGMTMASLDSLPKDRCCR